MQIMPLAHPLGSLTDGALVDMIVNYRLLGCITPALVMKRTR